MLASVHGPAPPTRCSTGPRRRSRLCQALGTSATAAVLALGLWVGTADAAEAVAAPEAGAVQSQDSVSTPSEPSAKQLVARAEEKANAIVREVQSRISAGTRAIPPSEPATPANAAPSSVIPATSPDPSGVAPVEVPATDAPAEHAVDPVAPATAAPTDSTSPSTETAGSVVLDESGGFRQERRTRDAPRRSSHSPTGSAQAPAPVAAAHPPVNAGRRGDSSRRAPGHRPTPPPEEPGMPMSAAPGSSSGMLFGIGLVSLLVLISWKVPGAPRRRLAPPADRPCAPPFVPALERPG